MSDCDVTQMDEMMAQPQPYCHSTTNICPTKIVDGVKLEIPCHDCEYYYTD